MKGPGSGVWGPGSIVLESGLASDHPASDDGFRSAVHRVPAARGPAPSIHSAIYEGTVTHHRSHPVEHRFAYRLFHLYLDLDELDVVFLGTRWWRNEAAAPATFRRRDHLPGTLPLVEQVRALVAERIGHHPTGAVRLLTHVRMTGVSFNPVSFYYCFDADGALAAIVAEITNIPWLERHCYVLDCRGRTADGLEFDLDKEFHISPFMGMFQRYRWNFSVPGEALSVHMTSLEDGRPQFSASLAHRRRVLTPSRLDALLWRYPLMPLHVIGGIYGQAARLWWKGVPVCTHPGGRREPSAFAHHHSQPGLPDLRTALQVTHGP